MTFQQLRIAVEVARTGSITKAGKNLYLSQPNISGVLAALERELGYKIFNRGGSGITLTAEGSRFLEHAKAVLSGADALYAIRDSGRICRLRLGMQSYSPAVEAFIRLAESYRDQPGAELKCINISAEAGMLALSEMELDVVAALISPHMLPHARRYAADRNLSLHFLREIPTHVNLRRGHPLLAQLTAGGEALDFRQLSQYPYVEYQKLPARTEDYTTLDDVDLTGFPNRIVVDERDARYRIVSRTNAFSVGCYLSPALQERYGLTSVTIPGKSMHLYCITRRGDEETEEIARYIQFLREELQEK